MTKPLFKIQSVTNKQTKKNKKTPNFCFSRRRAAADLHQTLHEDRGCPYNFCTLPLDFFNPTSSFGARGLRTFWGKCPIAVLLPINIKFLIYESNRTKF